MSPTRRAATGAFPVQRITAGVDWLTFIADGRSNSEQLVEALRPVARDLVARGEKRQPFRFMKWKGEKVGALRFGTWQGTAVAQLSGGLCDSTWTRLVSLPGRATRIDLQTTLTLSESRTEFARSLLRPAAKTRQRRQGGPRRTSYSSSTSGLRIGTVGRRIDRSYLRVYDKGVEAETHKPGILWRVELEAKRDLAPKLWDRLKKETDVPQMCYGSCAHAWKQSDLRWPLPKPGACYALPPEEKSEEPPAHRLAAWLRTSVAPTIPRVLTVFSVADVLDMLGMSHLANPSSDGGQDA